MVAKRIIEVATMWILWCCKPISVLNNIFIGMKNWSKVIKSNTGNTVAGQNSKNAYNMSIVLKKIKVKKTYPIKPITRFGTS